MASDGNVYRSSGAMGKGLITVPLAAIAVTLVCAFLYGYVCVYNPLAGIVSFLIPLAYGAGIALTMFGAAKFAHCRNPRFLQIAGIACAAFAIYAAWASFMSVLLRRELPDAPGMMGMMAEPTGMWQLVGLINETGWFTVKHLTPSGIVLWIFWLAEAGIIAALIVWLPGSMLVDSVYCESCKQWCKEKKGISTFGAPPMGTVEGRIKSGDLVALADLSNDEGGMKPFLRLDTQRCEKCSDTATFQVVHVTRTMKDGKKTENEDKWTQHVLLNPASLQAFQDALVRRTAAGTAVPAAAPSDPAAPAAPPA